jgi:hypothetical protein
MATRKERQSLGREKLSNIIETCRAVEERSLDPFLIDVKQDIEAVKEYFPNWTIAEDLCLDAATIHHLASVIKLQGEWVKHRSTSLYTDPFLLEEKLRSLSKEETVDTFAQAWHPIIELEQISVHSLAEAMGYWINLVPIEERWKEKPPDEVETGSASREQLLKEQVIRDKAFSEELENFWRELQESVQERGEDGRIRYWRFINGKTYDETVKRAFMTSFLVTYGYATLEIYPLEEEIFLRPNEKPELTVSKKQLVSIPISVSAEEWKKQKEEEPQ